MQALEAVKRSAAGPVTAPPLYKAFASRLKMSSKIAGRR